LYSPALSALIVTVAFAPGAMTFSCFRSLLSNSIAFLFSLAISTRKRLPAGTSSTAGSNLPSFATSLKRGTSWASVIPAKRNAASRRA
jgi:hypothetical protein